MKTNKLMSLMTIFFISACAPVSVINNTPSNAPTSTATPTQTNGTFATVTPLPSLIPSILPSLTPTSTPTTQPTPAMPTNIYTLPLKFRFEAECDLGSWNAIEINKEGLLTATTQAGVKTTKQLSAPEISYILNSLNSNDIAKYSNDNVIDKNLAETGECRYVEFATFMVNGKEQTFSYLVRNTKYSQPYVNSIKKLKSELFYIANRQYTLEASYTFRGGCNITSETSTVQANGNYIITKVNNETGNRSTETKQLSQDKTNSLLTLLNETDIFKYSLQNPRLDSSQIGTTADCRESEFLTLLINGEANIFSIPVDDTRYKMNLNPQYIASFDTIKAKIKEIGL